MIFANTGGRRSFVFEETVLERCLELVHAIQNLIGYTQATSASLVYFCTTDVFFFKICVGVVDFLAWFCNRSLDPVTWAALRSW